MDGLLAAPAAADDGVEVSNGQEARGQQFATTELNGPEVEPAEKPPAPQPRVPHPAAAIDGRAPAEARDVLRERGQRGEPDSPLHAVPALVEELLWRPQADLAVRVKALSRGALEAVAQELISELKQSDAELQRLGEFSADARAARPPHGARKAYRSEPRLSRATRDFPRLVEASSCGDIAAAAPVPPALQKAHDAENEEIYRARRVPEEKAQEIFDRLHNNAREHALRRKVYSELGRMAEGAQAAPISPRGGSRVELAAETGGPARPMVPAGPADPVGERLFRDNAERQRRREEFQVHGKPAYPFRPQICTYEGQADKSADATAERLFQEHTSRRQRQEQRIQDDAEWRKHSFRPDISKSQLSGPQPLRG